MAEVGRPTEYNDEILKKSQEYIKSRKDDGKEVKLPTLEGLALYLDVSRKSLYNWAEKHSEFLHTLGIIERKQKEKLIAKGLSGDYNSTIAKLMLSSNHGMKERTENENTGEVKITITNYGDKEDKPTPQLQTEDVSSTAPKGD